MSLAMDYKTNKKIKIKKKPGKRCLEKNSIKINEKRCSNR